MWAFKLSRYSLRLNIVSHSTSGLDPIFRSNWKKCKNSFPEHLKHIISVHDYKQTIIT